MQTHVRFGAVALLALAFPLVLRPGDAAAESAATAPSAAGAPTATSAAVAPRRAAAVAPGAVPAARVAQAAHGVLRSVAIRRPGEDLQRHLHVWRQAGGDTTRALPVLYVMAGAELFDPRFAPDGEEWGFDEFLAAQPAGILDLLVVAVEPGPDALRELAPPGSRTDGSGEAYAHFVAEVVKPYVDAHWATRRDAASTWIAGEEVGGAFAIYMAWTHPTVFGTGIALGMPAPDRKTAAWCEKLPPPPAPRLWIDRVTSAMESPSTIAFDAALGRGARLQIRQAGPHVARIVRLAAALRYAAQP